MEADVRAFVRACGACVQGRGRKERRAPLGHTYKGNEPMGSLVVDFVGPILTSSEGNGYLLTCIDTFSRYAWAIPAADTTSHTAGDALINQVMLPFGFPKYLVTDNASSFTGQLMKMLCRRLQMRHMPILPYMAQDSLVERLNKSFIELLRPLIMSRNRTDWEELVIPVRASYNANVHISTGLSPYFCLFMREYKAPQDYLKHQYVEESDYQQDPEFQIARARGVS